MAAKSQRPKERRDGVLSSLNEAIDAMNLAEVPSIAPAKAAFGSARVLLTKIRVGFPPVHGGRLLANVYRTQ